MQSSYNGWLVALSLAVAMLASYTTLDISSRIAMLVVPARRRRWLIGGAMSMGLGIWSMHFIGMLAFSLPIPLGYDFPLTAASLAIAIGASFCALYLITHKTLTPLRLIVGGIIFGVTIAAMHYTGMAALRMLPAIHYDLAAVLASIAIAVGAAIAALWIGNSLSDANLKYVIPKRICAAVVMGCAIAGMHYTGMAAASFPSGSICRAAQKGLDTHWLATTVTLVTIGILIITLLLSRFDASTSSLLDSVSFLNGQMVRLATLDPLTDLPNRATLMQHIAWAIDKSKLTKRQFALLFIDLDGFKMINDSLGHAVGDGVLKAFAGRLRQAVRGSDTVARLGGDEFVILLEGLSSQEDAERMAEEVLRQMDESLLTDGIPLRVTPSIGIALYPSDGESAGVLLKNADAAMYVAKQAGRNSYRFFEARMNEAAMRAMEIQRALHEALDSGYLRLEFQPKFAGLSGELTGAEALVRLQHPVLGLLGPLEFIPVAERSGQIIPIGYWVLRETCRHIRHWDEQGLPPIKIAVNLSQYQLKQPDLVCKMRDIVTAAGVGSDRIMFEITETVAMHDAAKTADTIHTFQRQGFDVAIDDFGTGYSSLAYLQRFRVKQLKIDRFFTSSLDTHGEEGRAIVAAIISLAHSLHMDVVAEGVESENQLNELKSLQCDQVQGFLLANPLPPDEMGALMKSKLLQTLGATE